MYKILIIDDEILIRELIKRVLILMLWDLKLWEKPKMADRLWK